MSFMQTHLGGAKALIASVQELAPEQAGRVVDLYAGVGLLSLALAPRAKSLIAVERDGPSARDGKANLLALGRPEVEMCEKGVEAFLQKTQAADLVVVDPPRSGCGEEVLEGISGQIGPSTILYVSCDLRSFVRDAEKLLQEGYRLEDVRALDLFPHTAHLELVTRFCRNEGN